jgi:hypothetical protein
MADRNQKTVGPDEKEITARQAGAASDDSCRCKEVSVMPPRKLFGLMLSDLAFWKKAKKG